MSQQYEELLTACAEGNIEKVREILASLRRQGDDNVPLNKMALTAAENHHADILELCIDEGADVSDLDLDDLEFPDVIKVLITKGGRDINEDWETGGDLLINAVWELKYDLSKWLLEHGSDPNSGHLMADSTSAMTAAAERGRLDFLELLVGHHAKIGGDGALVAAADNKHVDVVVWLLDRGAKVDEIGVHDYGDSRKKKYEGTALHKAAANGDLEMAKLLVAHKARLDIKDPLDRTPLDRALEEGRREVAEYLKSLA